MDIEKILNNVVFNYGWRVDSDFILFGKNNSIKIIFDSYDENELINAKSDFLVNSPLEILNLLNL